MANPPGVPNHQGYGRDRVWRPADLDGEWELLLVAVAEFGRFFDDVERRCADGEDLAPVASWAARQPDNALRVAGLLRLAEHVSLGTDACARSISDESMQQSVQICRGLIADGL